MYLSRSFTHFSKYAIAALVTLAITYYLFATADQFLLSSDGSLADTSSLLISHVQTDAEIKEQAKGQFINDVVGNDVDGPMDLAPLTELCARTEWQEGLLWKCQELPGGIGNVRNMLLNCLRYAIEAGATGLVMPECQYRNASDLSHIHTHNQRPLSYLIDSDHFVQSLSVACPQIILYPTDADLPIEVDATFLANHTLQPFELAPSLMQHTLMNMTGPEWRIAFDSWIRHEIRYPEFSKEKPAFIFAGNCLLRWPFINDSPSFVAHFGRILQSRTDTRRLAGAVLYALDQKYNLGLDYTKPLKPGLFMGAHLRTASDAAKVGWPDYDSQITNYFNAAKGMGINLVYLTTGAPLDAKRFTATAQYSSLEVLSKDLLLSPDEYTSERNALEELTWDQRALVDFEVSLRTSYFVGMFESSFTWNVALRRHVVVGRGVWEEIGMGKQGLEGEEGVVGGWVGESHGEAFRDRLSAVYGPVDLGIRWQFPVGLWP